MFSGSERIGGARSLDVQDAERMDLLHFDVIGNQQLLQMFLLTRPRRQLGLQRQRVLLEPDEKVADDVGMLGEEQRRQDITRMRTLHIGAAHSMEKRPAIVARHAHHHAVVEQAEARALGQRIIFGGERSSRGRISIGANGTHATNSIYEPTLRRPVTSNVKWNLTD